MATTATATGIPYFSVCENTGKYEARRKLTALQIINAAKKLLSQQVCKGAHIASRGIVRNYLFTHYFGRKNEVFICLFLDTKMRLIKTEEMFSGTVDSAAVYPRVVAQRCLELNASAVMFAHNHPSGNNKPSAGDIQITKLLIDALKLIDVRVYDHFIIGAEYVYSFADHELLEGACDG